MARQRQRVIRRREFCSGKGVDDVADALDMSPRAYRDFEAGKSMLSPWRLPKLAQILNWTPDDLADAIEQDERPLNGHAVPGTLDHLASLEQAAAEVHAFEAVAVHGLLQTATYAEAIERAESPWASESVARRVQHRLDRQAALRREPDPLRLTVILDESVLHRVAGARDVMADQLRQLTEDAERPNIDVRVLPLDAGVFPFGSFTLFTKPDAKAPFMAVTEDRGGAHYMERPHDLPVHVALFAHLIDSALSPAESVESIQRIAKEHYQ
jgi:hypothetical protein